MTAAPALPPSVQAFLDIARRVTQAGSVEQFYDALREGYLALHRRLTDDPAGAEAEALRAAFTAAHASLDLRVALQLCAMPLYEKPVLPVEDGAPPEFLWLFALPVVVRFSEQTAARGPLVWPAEALPAAELLAQLEASGRIEPRAQLGLFAQLYTRADLLAWGPENLALHAVNAELAEAAAPTPLPVSLSGQLPAYRSVLFFALGVARLPFGVRSLIQRRHDTTDLLAMQQGIEERLRRLGVDFDSVQVEPPCPVASSCFLTHPGFLHQLADNCAQAVQMGATCASVRFPVPGYLEIYARLPSGAELPVMLPEPCGEPAAVLLPALESVLRGAGLSVLASVATQAPAPATLQ